MRAAGADHAGLPARRLGGGVVERRVVGVAETKRVAMPMARRFHHQQREITARAAAARERLRGVCVPSSSRAA